MTAQIIRQAPQTGFESTLVRAREALLDLRDREEGWWNGEDEANQTLDAQYIFLFHYVGLLHLPEYQDKARRLCNRLRGSQRADGTWAIYYGAPGCVSVTTEAYAALKLMGDSPDAPHMARARAFVLANGGPAKTRMLTRFMLALLGELDWLACPSVPVQMMLAPRLTRFNIYELSYWARVCTVPLAVLADVKKVVPVPAGRGIRELYPQAFQPEDLYDVGEIKTMSWSNLFLQGDKLLKWAEKQGVSPLRKRSLKLAREWILAHQDDAGDWGGIFPAICNSLMALWAMGMTTDDDVFQRGMGALERFEWPDLGHGETHIAPCVSPVWDTGWAVLACVEAGIPADDPRICQSVEWLRSMQIKRKGDWAVKAPHVPAGGWAFQFHNDFYPDTDDSAVVMMALTNGDPATLAERGVALELGKQWLLGMQNADGGWGAFELEINEEVYNEILYNDEKNMLDPSTVDVTARIVEMLGVMGASRDDPVVRRAEAYMRREQEPNGSWWGRWGVNYVYGTWSVLRGLAAVGIGGDDPAVKAGGDWLESYQQEDGGWGESCASYTPGREFETIPSTASQTAWGVLGLIAAGRADSESTRRGVAWLQRTQEPDGLWSEDAFTGTGFPDAFYLKYHYYAKYFPVLALGAYQNATGTA